MIASLAIWYCLKKRKASNNRAVELGDALEKQGHVEGLPHWPGVYNPDTPLSPVVAYISRSADLPHSPTRAYPEVVSCFPLEVSRDAALNLRLRWTRRAHRLRNLRIAHQLLVHHHLRQAPRLRVFRR